MRGDSSPTKDFSGDVERLFEMLERIVLEQENSYKSIVDSIVETICRFIKRNLDIKAGSPVVRRLKEAIYAGVTDPGFNLASLIDSTGFNKDHLRRLFKRETGKTILRH